jgi:hypothetical protein
VLATTAGELPGFQRAELLLQQRPLPHAGERPRLARSPPTAVPAGTWERRSTVSCFVVGVNAPHSPPPDIVAQPRESGRIKIRPYPGRQTLSHVGTQPDTTRTNQQARASQPFDRRRHAFQVTKSRASRSGIA